MAKVLLQWSTLSLWRVYPRYVFYVLAHRLCPHFECDDAKIVLSLIYMDTLFVNTFHTRVVALNVVGLCGCINAAKRGHTCEISQKTEDTFHTVNGTRFAGAAGWWKWCKMLFRPWPRLGYRVKSSVGLLKVTLCPRLNNGVSETGCPRLADPYRLSSFEGDYRQVCESVK